MTKPRVVETDQGIQGELNVQIYDQMQRGFRDKGIMATQDIIKSGIDHGHVLEIGPGPGYLGLEWLKNTTGTTLTGLEISPDMIEIAQRNALDYSLADRVQYVPGSGEQMLFTHEMFDAVFSNGSLHEWNSPVKTFAEIWRVLKPGGRLFISDLRRDLLPLVKWFMWSLSSPKEIRPGFITSVNAAYTPAELSDMIVGTDLTGCTVSGNPFGLKLVGVKIPVN